jgi:hypothetical protein
MSPLEVQTENQAAPSRSGESGTKPHSRTRRFRFDRPQQWAALLLLFLFAQCLVVSARAPLSETDYQFARCGREMWERPSAIAGYFTTCGNIHDGVLAYRLAGLPLTLQRIVAGEGRDTSTWEMRHELEYVRFLLHLPFMLSALVLGGALWWVTRRLFGNRGGYIALALFCCSPGVVRAATYPNADILAAVGLFATVYTAMGVAHAMQGPRRKWRPRIVLLALSFGTAAAAHSLALIIALPVAAIFMIYLAERRRTEVPMVLIWSALGALFFLFACYHFSADALSYYFRSGAARMQFGWSAARQGYLTWPNAGLLIAAGAALLLYVFSRRSRYFGNTAPLLAALAFLPIIMTGTFGEPWFWALPFALTFIAGVFADAIETPRGRLFARAVIALIVFQAVLSLASLPALAQ